MDEPLPAHSWAEVYYYLRVTPCPHCGRGPWKTMPREPAAQPQAAPGQRVHELAAVCEACGQSQTFRFVGPMGPAALADDALRPINSTNQPSRLIDVGGWLSLFYLLLESASKETDKPVARRLGYQAGQCLTEALKFYGDDELPDASAAWTASTRNALREHPEKFARQRLRDMQAKLPSMARMVRHVQADQARGPGGRRWWQFWKKSG